jgi:hypothetical protein
VGNERNLRKYPNGCRNPSSHTNTRRRAEGENTRVCWREIVSELRVGEKNDVGIWALRAMKGNSDGAGNSDVAGT